MDLQEKKKRESLHLEKPLEVSLLQNPVLACVGLDGRHLKSAWIAVIFILCNGRKEEKKRITFRRKEKKRKAVFLHPTFWNGHYNYNCHNDCHNDYNDIDILFSEKKERKKRTFRFTFPP
jgi:hypothetical protein